MQMKPFYTKKLVVLRNISNLKKHLCCTSLVTEMENVI